MKHTLAVFVLTLSGTGCMLHHPNPEAFQAVSISSGLVNWQDPFNTLWQGFMDPEKVTFAYTRAGFHFQSLVKAQEFIDAQTLGIMRTDDFYASFPRLRRYDSISFCKEAPTTCDTLALVQVVDYEPDPTLVTIHFVIRAIRWTSSDHASGEAAAWDEQWQMPRSLLAGQRVTSTSDGTRVAILPDLVNLILTHGRDLTDVAQIKDSTTYMERP